MNRSEGLRPRSDEVVDRGRAAHRAQAANEGGKEMIQGHRKLSGSVSNILLGMFVAGFVLAVAPKSAEADFCALGATAADVPAGQIIYEIRNNPSACPVGSGRQYRTAIVSTSGFPTPKDWACRPGIDYAIPPGWAPVQVDTTRGACGPIAASGLAWRLEQLSANQWVCAVWNEFAIPLGWVVTAVNENFGACDSGFTNTAYQINQPNPDPSGSSGWACRSGTASNWQLPPNFVIREIEDRAACRNGIFETGWRITNPVVAGGNNTIVCLPSPVPEGWVYTTDIQPFSICSESGTGSGFRIEPASDGEITCSISGIPDGFVIEDIVSATNLCGGDGFRLADLSQRSGLTYACRINSRPPPATHVVTQQGNYSRCASAGSAFGHRVKLAASGDFTCPNLNAPIPGNFIINEIDPSHPSCSSGRAERIELPIAGNTYRVCGNSPVPDGFFYTSAGTQSVCNGEFGYQIGPVVPGAESCSAAQIPANYVTVGVRSGPQCSPLLNFEVDLPSQTVGVGTEVCGGSNFPAEFVWVGSGNWPACSGQSQPDYRISVPSPTVGVITGVCAGSQVPPGFVITRYGDVGPCTLVSSADFDIQVPDPEGQTTVCELTNLPPNYVVVQIVSGSCGGAAAQVIQLPNPTGTTNVCNPFTLPTGYEVVATGIFGACGLGALTGSGATIRPTSTAVNPTPFINTEPDVMTPPTPPAPICPSVPASPPIVGGAPKNTSRCTW